MIWAFCKDLTFDFYSGNLTIGQTTPGDISGHHMRPERHMAVVK